MRTFTLLMILLCSGVLNVNAQYCMLPGRTIYSANQPGITSFKLNTIERTSGNVEKSLTEPSLVETGDTTELALGKTYTITMKHSKDAVIFPNARNNIRVWLDYNQDMDFTGTDETIVSSDYETAGTFTATFTVPMTAKLGYTRLRATAKMSDDAGHTIPTPCDMPQDPIDYHGEMEDYTINIVQFPTSVNELNNTKTISISPNPTNGIVRINFSNKTNNPVTISLVDITGKLIATPIKEQHQSADVYMLDINDYVSNNGIYFLKVLSGEEQLFEKLIKVD